MKNKAKATKESKESPLSVASKNLNAPGIKLLNPKREPLTPALLKTFSAYKDVSEKEAEEKCASIRTFARLLLEYLAHVENTTFIDNQQVISLDSNSDNKIVPIHKTNKKPKAA